jgi:hypothetical protein
MERGKALATAFMLLPRRDESKIERTVLTRRQGKVWLTNRLRRWLRNSRCSRVNGGVFPFRNPSLSAPVMGHEELCRI